MQLYRGARPVAANAGVGCERLDDAACLGSARAAARVARPLDCNVYTPPLHRLIFVDSQWRRQGQEREFVLAARVASVPLCRSASRRSRRLLMRAREDGEHGPTSPMARTASRRPRRAEGALHEMALPQQEPPADDTPPRSCCGALP